MKYLLLSTVYSSMWNDSFLCNFSPPALFCDVRKLKSFYFMKTGGAIHYMNNGCCQFWWCTILSILVVYYTVNSGGVLYCLIFTCFVSFYLPIRLSIFSHWYIYSPTCLFICRSTYLPVYLFFYMPVYLLISLPVYLVTFLPIYLSTDLPCYLSAFLPDFLSVCLPDFLSNCLPSYLSNCVPDYLSSYIHLSTWFLSNNLPVYLVTYLQGVPTNIGFRFRVLYRLCSGWHYFVNTIRVDEKMHQFSRQGRLYNVTTLWLTFVFL